MALTLDTSTTTTFTNATSATWSHTIGTSKSRVGLFVAVANRDDASNGIPPQSYSATYNSVAMTKAGEVLGDTGDISVAMFYMVAPASGAHNVAVSWSGSYPGLGACYAISYYGVDQGSPILSGSYTTTAEALATSISASVPSRAGLIVLDIMSMTLTFSTSETVTVGAGQTEIFNGEIQRTVRMGYKGSYEPATSTSTTMSWTWTNNFRRVGAAFTVNAATGGTSPMISPFLRV